MNQRSCESWSWQRGNKCMEIDSLFTFLTESCVCHAHIDLQNLVCTSLCDGEILLLENYSPCWAPNQTWPFFSPDPLHCLLCFSFMQQHLNWLLLHCILWSSQYTGLSEPADTVPKTWLASFWRFHSRPLYIISLFNLKWFYFAGHFHIASFKIQKTVQREDK